MNEQPLWEVALHIVPSGKLCFPARNTTDWADICCLFTREAWTINWPCVTRYLRWKQRRSSRISSEILEMKIPTLNRHFSDSFPRTLECINYINFPSFLAPRRNVIYGLEAKTWIKCRLFVSSFWPFQPDQCFLLKFFSTLLLCARFVLSRNENKIYWIKYYKSRGLFLFVFAFIQYVFLGRKVCFRLNWNAKKNRELKLNGIGWRKENSSMVFWDKMECEWVV